jgi:3-deoxy-D-manno-octulosonate 8-phosphate phosphatase KdsC-like HAD superfamily phosphatase
MPVISAVGLGVAVADAAPEVLAKADFVTQANGGNGAVRELVEMILRKTERWQGLVEHYYPCHLPEDQI